MNSGNLLAEIFSDVAKDHASAKFKIAGKPFSPSAPIRLVLDQSTANHLCLLRVGQPASIDDAIREGFLIDQNDTAAVLTLAQNFCRQRDEFSK